MTVPPSWRAPLLTLASALAAATPAAAAATDWSGDPRASVRLITGSDAADGSGAIEAGLEFRYAPGWHGYWRTPGDAGIAPTLDWSGSRNLGTPSVSWPAPTRLVVEGLQNATYEGRFTLPVRLGFADARAAAEVRLALDYAACATVCVPVHADLVLPLPAGPGGASAEASTIAAARASVPVSPAAAGIEVARRSLDETGSGKVLTLELRSRTEPFAHPDLFVEGAGDGLPPAPAVRLADAGRTAILTEPLPASVPSDAGLTLTVVDGAREIEVGPDAAGAPPVPGDARGLLAILAVALLGGLVLNVMPCVLPIVSIKLFALTRHAGAARGAVRLGLAATALGIVTSFLLLAAVLVGLKLSGATLGWGIQFQQPLFLAGMAALLVLFAASFFEWLPIGLPGAVAGLGATGSRAVLAEAFLFGAVSTLLATPCSAPFVGTAVGFALARGPGEIAGVFLCLGLGMASPFLAVALAPGLVARVPRPGPWMARVRRGLGVLLLGTAAWLLVVLWGVAGPGAAGAVACLLAAVLGFRAWVTPRGAVEERRWPGFATAALALGAVAAAALPATATGGRVSDGWQAFDPDRLAREVADGRTVLVDVTATWCLTCKVNEAAALETAAVRARLDRPGTVRMRADWSRPDPVIAAYLRRFGRYGIPLDVAYGPRRPEGEALPELLSAGTVTAALDRAGAPSAAAPPLADVSRGDP